MGENGGREGERVSRRRVLAGAAAGVGAGALAFPSIAAAATAPSVNVQDAPYEARGDGTTDDTVAIWEAIRAAPAGGTILVPPGTYKISRPLSISGKRLVGCGLDACIIRQIQPSLAVLVLDSDSTYVGDLTICHASTPTEQSVPNGVGIRLINLGDRSVIERCLIRDCTSGIYSREASAGGTSYVYSVAMRDLRIERFSHSGVYLSATNAGNTGCVLQTVYIVNREGETLFDADYGLFLQTFAQVLAQQINVEWGRYGWPITVNSCDTALVQSVNLEGCVGIADYGAFLSTFGGPNLGVRFSNVAVVNCEVDEEDVEAYALYRLDGEGRVTLDGVNVREMTRTGSLNLWRVYAGSLWEGAEPAISMQSVELQEPEVWNGPTDYYDEEWPGPPILRADDEYRVWTKGVVIHGEDEEAARPRFDSVEWIGDAEPSNRTANDTWVRP